MDGIILAGRRIKEKKPSRIKDFFKKHGTGYLFMLPFLALFFVFTVVPVFVAFGTSFTNYNILQPAKWLGVTNYKLLFMDDDIFLKALENTVIFACITGPIGYILSFMMAWLINLLKFKNIFALAFYAPSITSSVAMSVIWLVFFSSDRYGYINNFLIEMGIIGEPILWNRDPRYILGVIVFVSVWMSMGTGFLVFLAGLQSVPREYYEAGRIDGIVSRLHELWFITLPLVKPQLLFGAVNSIVNSFGVFDIAVQIAGMPSPNYAGHTIVAHLYDYAFIRFQMGYSSAVAVVLFLITFLLGHIVFRLLRTNF